MTKEFNNSTQLGFESDLWRAAEALRSNMDAGAPGSVVPVLLEMLAPYTGRVFDPCCGSGGMFVQSLKFIEAHKTGNGNGAPKGLSRAKRDISVYGQESNHTTWRLAKMNFDICGIDANLGKEHADNHHRRAFGYRTIHRGETCSHAQ